LLNLLSDLGGVDFSLYIIGYVIISSY